MDIPVRYDHLEVEPLKLLAKHFPLPISLRKPVLKRYTNLALSASDEQAMHLNELLEYIKTSSDAAALPLEAVLAQTEAIGDPALPTIEQVAVLSWLGAALQDWEIEFPIEEPLASQIRKMKPMLAALAITDPGFLTPGAHPMHQIMDTIQASAIGWQPRLGRAGQALERQVTRLVESVMAWFEDQDTDLNALHTALKTASERDETRAQRMIQRVRETEQGKVKTAAAKLQAATMINEQLARYQAPVGIGEFLKGPWYASAQLVLLKHGADSQQWQQMSATTNTLLDSLQTYESEDEERRQHLFQVVAQIPKELKRWLLNLHHDSEAVDDAVGLIEFAHLRVLRQQALVMQPIPPIETSDKSSGNNSPQAPSAMDDFATGQWFAIETAEGTLRVQLTLKIEEEQQLLFTNQAGLKTLQQGYQEFIGLHAQNKVKPLYGGASFSACLASAAGLDTVEDLALLNEARAEQDRQRQETAQAERQRLESQRMEVQRQETEQLERQSREAQQLKKQQQEAAKLEQQRLEAERLEQEQQQLEAARVEKQQLEAARLEQQKQETERLEQQRRDAQQRALEQQERDRQDALQMGLVADEPPAEETEQEEEERLEREWEKARQAQAAREAEEKLKAQQEHAEWEAGREQEQQDQKSLQGKEIERLEQQRRESQLKAREEADEQAKIEEYLRQKQERTERQDQAQPQQRDESSSEDKVVNLPMGAWLGFHDGDTPLLAKLAVHDREQDQYFFVNREGIKMRQLSKGELLALMERGLVDIMQTNTNFREEVTRIRGQLEE